MTDKLKSYVLKALPYVVCAAVGVAVGWEVKPDRVEIQERVRVEQVEKQVVVIQEQVRVEVVKVKDTQVVERWHREKTEERRPDGTVISKEVEDRNIDTVIHDRENKTEVRVVEVEKQVVVVQKETVEKVVRPVLADWKVGVLAGIQPQFRPELSLSNYVLGAEVDRRIAGPFWVGVWGTSSNSFQVTAGLKASVEF
jgi:hypothetical protein